MDSEKRVSLNISKGPVLEQSSTANLFTGHKLCWNLHGALFSYYVIIMKQIKVKNVSPYQIRKFRTVC